MIHTRLIAVTALLGTIACGAGSDSTTGPTDNDPVGLYALRTVDGKTIPTEVARDSYYDPLTDTSFDIVVQVTGGEIILSEDGSFRLAVDIAYRAGAQEERDSAEHEGTYEITGSKISFNDGAITGTLRNGDITVELPSFGKQGTSKFIYRLAR